MLINLSCQAVAMKARRVSTDPFPKLSLNFLRSDLNLILSWVQVARNSYKCTAQLFNNKKKPPARPSSTSSPAAALAITSAKCKEVNELWLTKCRE